MSIQAGIWNFDDAPLNGEDLAKLSKLIEEYSEEKEVLHLEENVGMLYRAFHTTPESFAERQPAVLDQGIVVLWDGRLDNREELIARLGDAVDNGSTDLRIVSAAYRQLGTECFKMLVGDWALSIWNPVEKELVLARDYIGVRRLFYYPAPKRLMWCSTLTPLMLYGDRFKLCDAYLAGYLSVMPDPHLTPYQEILSVPPGSFVRVTRKGVTIQDFWRFDASAKTRCKNDAEYEEHFRVLFQQAVRCRLRSNFPILADLSGGLDSSSIVCMVDHICATEQVGVSAVDTFTFFDPEEPDEEDILFFRKVEERRGRSGHHVKLQGLGDTIEIDRPTSLSAPGLAPRLELTTAKAAVIRQGQYRVILSGNGGDYMLGQGLDPRIAVGDALISLRPIALINRLVEWSLMTRQPALRLLSGAFALLLPRRIRGKLTAADKTPAWVNRHFARRYAVGDRILPGTVGPASWLPSTREKYQSLARLRGELTHSVIPHTEMRYPYLDRRLVEFLFSIPGDQLVRAGQRRSIMRRALAGMVPEEVLSRRTKSGTGRCIVSTVNKHSAEVIALLKEPLSVQLGYLDGSSLRSALSDLQQGKVSRYVGPLLKALTLETWLREITKRGVLYTSSIDDINASTAAKADMHAVCPG
jgi:asparagine synthase (glutamine-hydrolysing)